ncbi:MAG: ferredoxin [Patescibacteria group bacterium]
MLPHVNKETCIGCGTCPAIAGKTFKMEDDGKAVVFNPAGDDEATIKMAADSCPVQAISLE